MLKQIEYLKSVLASEALVRTIIKDELTEIREDYKDDRRTQIVKEEAEISLEDLIAEEEVVVTISHAGYIKRNAVSLYRAQRRGGKGKIGMGIKDEDFVETLFTASTHDTLLFFTDAGKVYWLKVHEIPEASRAAKGKALVNLLALTGSEKVTATLPVKEYPRGPVCDHGHQERPHQEDGTSPPTAIRGRAASSRLDWKTATNSSACRSPTANGRYSSGRNRASPSASRKSEVRPMGRTAYGVKGITLEEGNEVIGMETITPDSTTAILTVTEGGYGKRTPVGEYRVQGRGGKGIISVKTTERNGLAVGFLQVRDGDEIMLMAAQGKVLRCKVGDIREIGRNTQGVRILDLDGDEDRVVAVARLADSGEREEAGPDEGAAGQ